MQFYFPLPLTDERMAVQANQAYDIIESLSDKMCEVILDNSLDETETHDDNKLGKKSIKDNLKDGSEEEELLFTDFTTYSIVCSNGEERQPYQALPVIELKLRGEEGEITKLLDDPTFIDPFIKHSSIVLGDQFMVTIIKNE